MYSFIVPQKFNTIFKCIYNILSNKKRYHEYTIILINFFKNIYSNSDIYLTGAGRVSIFYSLSIFKTIYPKKSEVIVTSFTCASVIDSILRCNLKPVYVDFSTITFGTDSDSVKKSINSKTLAIIVQHTFGVPCYIDEIIKHSFDKDVFIIEDCAISFLSKYNNNTIGTYGDISTFSFDHSKPINLLMGGAIVCNNPDLKYKFKKVLQNRKSPSLLYEISLIFYMFFDFIIYNCNNRHYQHTIRLFYAILKKIKLIKDPIIRKFYNNNNSISNYQNISLVSLTIFYFEKNRINSLLQLRKKNYNILINYLINNKHKLKIANHLNISNDLYPLRILIVVDKYAQQFFNKFFDTRFYWFKEPIIAREGGYELYKYKMNEDHKQKNIFKNIINISLNMNNKELEILLKKLNKFIDYE